LTRLGGYHPFDPYGVATEDELQDNVRKLKFDFDDEVWEKVSEEAKDLIVAMLRHDPKERPSAKRVLMHPWIAKFAPGGDDDLSPAASKSQSAVRKPPTKNSVDESLFVDPVGRSESKRRSGTGRNSNGHDANPSNRSSHHDRPSVHEDRDRGRQRHDSNSTWMSKSKRTLRPTHRPADAYEPVIASPDMKASAVRSVQRTSMKEMPMPDYRAGPRAEMSSRDVFTQQPGYSAVPSYKPTDSLHRDRSVVDSRKSGRGSHGANLEYNVSRSTVGMDAGVVFRPQKPMATSHQFGGNTILAVHQHHQDMRRGRSVGVDRDDLDDAADGWQDAEFDAYARRAVQSSYGFQGQPHRARDHELASSGTFPLNSMFPCSLRRMPSLHNSVPFCTISIMVEEQQHWNVAAYRKQAACTAPRWFPTSSHVTVAPSPSLGVAGLPPPVSSDLLLSLALALFQCCLTPALPLQSLFLCDVVHNVRLSVV
jgi:hypothetical protein